MATQKNKFTSVELVENNIPGIYKITNKLNGKFYIGSASDLYARQSEHFDKLRKGIHKNPYLQNSYNKYNVENFNFEILKIVNKEELLDCEQWFLDTLSPHYNINPLATSRLGAKLTKKQIEHHCNIRRKPVIQCDLSGNELKLFNSCKEVLESFGLKKTGQLCDHLKGKHKTFKGYYFKYTTK